MRAGKLRHRVTIQRETAEGDPGYVADGEGGYELAWIDVATVWASVRPLSVKEQTFAAQLQDSRTHEVRLRWRNGLTAAHRLLFKGRPLNIRGVQLLDEIQHEMLVQVEEGVAT